MSLAARPQGEVKKWRIIVFVIVGGLLALLALYAGARDLLLLDGQPGFPSEVHRWHEAQSGVFTALLFGGSLLALLRRPQRKPLLVVFVVLSLALVSLAFATVSGAGFNPLWLAVGAALICILVAAYPAPRTLLHFRRGGHPSYFLLALTLIAAVLLAPIMARELNWQLLGITGQDVHQIRELVAAHPQQSRRALSQTLCRAWDWRQANGVPREMVWTSQVFAERPSAAAAASTIPLRESGSRSVIRAVSGSSAGGIGVSGVSST